MEGLIPFLLHAIKKQRPQNITRCLSDNSTTGRSYHLLLSADSTEGSSHRRTRSEFQPPLTTVDHLAGTEHLKSFSPRAPVAAPFNMDNGLRQRALNSGLRYQESGVANKHRR